MGNNATVEVRALPIAHCSLPRHPEVVARPNLPIDPPHRQVELLLPRPAVGDHDRSEGDHHGGGQQQVLPLREVAAGGLLLPEPSLSPREVAQGSEEVDPAKAGPMDVHERVLGVGRLPQQKA